MREATRARRVVLADDSALSRRAVRSLLKNEAGFEIVGEAGDGFEALQLARELGPDLILMDLDMPHCDGLLATRLIKRELPSSKVVILTVSDDAADLFEAIQNGAQGYLLKSLAPADWLKCLRNLANDEAPPRELARRILAGFAAPVPVLEPSLTEREREVLRLVAAAMTNRQVAEALYVSEQTVKNHLKSIMRKLRLKNRVELALYARRSA
ncbi:MAG TPA: response regulator transcription factor [Rubrobacteraceae bacterium]|nr:response regulator transcription factor [Rubrobacteraceae bacterium]